MNETKANQQKRNHSVCWKTFVQPKKETLENGTISQDELAEALEDLRKRQIPIQYGDFVTFANAPNDWGKDAYCAYLYIFDGEKLIEMGQEPDEHGCVPRQFVCLDPTNFREPWSYMANIYSENNELQEKRGPQWVTWFRPGPFLKQIQQNLTDKKTWFEYEGKKYTLWNECECDDFKSLIGKLKENTLIYAMPRGFLEEPNKEDPDIKNDPDGLFSLSIQDDCEYYDEAVTKIRANRLKELADDRMQYVVLDFEATCWKDNDDHEIIEWPMLLLDFKYKNIREEFFTFVKPKNNPVLSDFCKELTGITQEQVDGGISFEAALSQALKWLEETKKKYYYVRTTFLICGNWDLEKMLPMEMKNHNIEASKEMEVFTKWINIKDLFKKRFPDAQKPSMPDMLAKLELPLVGRHHRGIDDCRNLAQIVFKLYDLKI